MPRKNDDGDWIPTPGDTVLHDGSAWQISELDREDGWVTLMRKNTGELPLLLTASIDSISINSPGGSFIGGYGRVHGSANIDKSQYKGGEE